MRNYTFAKIAYDAYCKQTGGKSLVTGDTLPDFFRLSEAIQDAWYGAANAVLGAMVPPRADNRELSKQ